MLPATRPICTPQGGLARKHPAACASLMRPHIRQDQHVGIIRELGMTPLMRCPRAGADHKAPSKLLRWSPKTNGATSLPEGIILPNRSLKRLYAVGGEVDAIPRFTGRRRGVGQSVALYRPVPWHDYREKATRARWNADKRADSVALNE